MYKDSTIKYISDTLLRLQEANVSIYKISKELDEPESTLHNILKSNTTKYSEERVLEILDRITYHLDESSGKEKNAQAIEPFDNIPTYTKLYEVGLNSKVFTPEEKLHLATMHQKLTKLKNQRNENPK